MNDSNELFDTKLLIDRWESPADLRNIRQWQRRLGYKKLIWRGTYGLAESVKRVLDIGGSLTAIAIFSPIFIGTAMAIKLEDGGPILFIQDRVGRGGRLFKVFKFRSMVQNANKLEDQQTQDSPNLRDKKSPRITKAGKTEQSDPRITNIGRIIRKYSLDEFPQFFNVLLGDMSLVGPRPPIPQEVAKYKAMHLRRLAVKPGITCLWQVGGRSDIDFEGQVRLDLQYIASESIWNDIMILLKTVPAVIKGDGAY